MPLDTSGIIRILKRIHLFHNMEDARVEACARLMDPIEVGAGQMIFDQGADPDYFYIVADGRVRIFQNIGRARVSSPDSTIQLGFLEEDDYFGEEILQGDWARRISAKAESDVTLLRISVEQFQDMLEIFPQLGQRLQTILDSYRLLVQVASSFTWRDSDEAILFVTRRHVLFLMLKILPPIVLGIFAVPALVLASLSMQSLMLAVLAFLALIMFSLWLLWSYVDWTNDYYILTSQRIISQVRVILFYDSRQEYPLHVIQSTTTNTSQWGRWFGFGNVAIRTYYGTLLFRDVNQPEHIMTFIQQEQLRAQFSQRRMNVREIGEFLDRRIVHGLQRPALPEPRRAQSRPDPMREFFSSMFHQRYQQGKTIIYRTVWYLMLKKIFFPSLLLFALVVLFFVSAANNFPILSGAVTCGFSFLVGIATGLWWLYEYVDWQNDRYLITTDQVVDVYKKPIGQEERQAALIKNILSIEYKQVGLLRQLLNYGTVYISVGDRQLTFDDVYQPSEVQRELFHRLQEVTANEKAAQAEADKQRLGDWFASYNDFHKPSHPDADASAQGVQGGF